MTKREALQITAELWEWLAEHPKEDKSHWPGWVTHAPECAFNCPCCEYVADKHGLDRDGFGEPSMDCSLVQDESDQELLNSCPLKKLWPKGCWDHSSPFRIWAGRSVTLKKERELSAMTISKAAKEALKRLETKELK